MAHIDKLIERLLPGQELLLETKKEPLLKNNGSSRVMVNQLLSSQQIIMLITDIAPELKKDDVRNGKQAAFEYVLGDRTHTVSYTCQGEVIKCAVAAVGTAPAVSPAPTVIPASTVTAKPAVPGEPEINALFRAMVDHGASDLHLTSNHRPMIRESGDMIDLQDQPVIAPDRLKKLLHEIMPNHNSAQFEAMHDTDFPYEIPGLARFRANVFSDRFGMGAVFRQIPIEIVTAEKLGLSKAVLDLCYLSKGLVLVTGPTGSGKSTTLCALIDFINRNRNLHIITIEDPIEFVHQKKKCLINQREVHVHTKSFSNALRAALREDPDIILVGEMRDLETISIAIETAETGHLVFGTLHTTTAASTVDRIIDQFAADRQAQIRTMLASSLKGVIAQTLCKKVGGGRMAAQEVLFVTTAVSNLIREGKIFQIPSIIQTSKAQGMVLMNDALFKLVVEGKVAPEEAYIKAIEKAGFLSLLKSRGINLNMALTAE